jgi:alpha-L-fucosidase
MGDNEIPNRVIAGAWETAATINDTWGYKKDDHNWKQPDNITFKLVDIVSKGGNYLLNVGPMGDGSIPQPSQDILRRVGKWLKTNGEAVYGAGKTPFGDEFRRSDWRCTVRPMDWTWGQPGKLYFHLFKWPAPGAGVGVETVRKFDLAAVKGKIKQSYLLADPDRKPLEMETSAAGTGISVRLPAQAADELDSVLCVEVE